MERNITVPGIILRTRRFQEKHKSVTILTDQYGIIDAIQYGVATGKALGLSDQFVSGTFHLYHNPVRDSWKLNEVSGATLLERVPQDIFLLYGASFCAEVLLKTHIGGGEFHHMRNLFQETLVLFERDYPKDVVLIRFMWRFLQHMGVIDGVKQCVECDSVVTEEASLYLDEKIPGLVCVQCCHPTMMKLSAESRTLLLHMEQYSWAYLKEQYLKAQLDFTELKQILLRIIEIIADGRLQTLSSGMI